MTNDQLMVWAFAACRRVELVEPGSGARPKREHVLDKKAAYLMAKHWPGRDIARQPSDSGEWWTVSRDGSPRSPRLVFWTGTGKDLNASAAAVSSLLSGLDADADAEAAAALAKLDEFAVIEPALKLIRGQAEEQRKKDEAAATKVENRKAREAKRVEAGEDSLLAQAIAAVRVGHDFSTERRDRLNSYWRPTTKTHKSSKTAALKRLMEPSMQVAKIRDSRSDAPDGLRKYLVVLTPTDEKQDFDVRLWFLAPPPIVLTEKAELAAAAGAALAQPARSMRL